MKFLLILVLAVPIYSQVEVKYDKFKDESVVRLDGGRLGLAKVAVFYVSKGETPTRPDSMWFTVSRYCELKCGNDRQLIILADGERFDLGRGAHDLIRDRFGLYERMAYSVPIADLALIADAKKVELQLGSVEAKLSDKQKAGIKELLAYK